MKRTKLSYLTSLAASRVIKAAVITICIALIGAFSPALAQDFGIAALLNPEGSRLFPQTLIFPRHPGKPDPRWRNFNWRYTDVTASGARYRLYFYTDEEWTARYAIPKIDEQILELSKKFNYTPSKPFSYLLFATLREFQQATIFNIAEGVQGITSTTEATMAIPYWGETETYRHISTHEMVHQFQVQKADDLGSANAETAMMGVPLWFIEGMAEYYSLRGIDLETRFFVRDLIAYPDKKKDYAVPKFFDETPYTFSNIYKMGQVRLAFLEDTFGAGSTQRIFGSIFKDLGTHAHTFRELVSTLFKTTENDIEDKWRQYLDKTFGAELASLSQDFDSYSVVEPAGENLDLYDLSPDGTTAAIREINPLSGQATISLIDFSRNNQKIEIVRDNVPGVLSLYFLQFPTLTLSNHLVVYVVATTSGPEIEIRALRRKGNGNLELGETRRIDVHKIGLIQASYPAISPNEKGLAIVGNDASGRQNVYIVDLEKPGAPIKAITAGYFSWRTLIWNDDGIFGASDRTTNQKYALFRLDSGNGIATQLTAGSENQLSPEPVDGTDGASASMYFQSWESGSPQIHLIKDGIRTQITDAKTGLSIPKYRQGTLYALGFRTGRYHLYRVPTEKLLAKSMPMPGIPEHKLHASAFPWTAPLTDLSASDIHAYRPFRSSGTRIDNIMGFFSSGGVAGLGANVSDLMRNYSISGEFTYLGDIKHTNTAAFFNVHKGRLMYTTGAYHTVQSRIDNIFTTDHFVRSYLHREFGMLGAIEYPLTAFSYVDAELRLSGVKRSDFSDSLLAPEWDARNPGTEFILAPTFRLGYDRILYEAYSGPFSGYGILGESETSFFPRRQDTAQRFRIDAARYFNLVGRTILAFQFIGGAALTGTYRDTFFVSSDDMLRAYPFGDDRLRGDYLAAGRAELRFPIGTFFGFPPLRGMIGYDYGTVFSHWGDAGNGIASATTTGLSLNVPPLSINFMLSYPDRLAPGPSVDGPVTHFTLRYLYL